MDAETCQIMHLLETFQMICIIYFQIWNKCKYFNIKVKNLNNVYIYTKPNYTCMMVVYHSISFINISFEASIKLGHGGWGVEIWVITC